MRCLHLSAAGARLKRPHFAALKKTGLNGANDPPGKKPGMKNKILNRRFLAGFYGIFPGLKNHCV